MKILIVHNYYQIAGGEDAVMQNEITLLEEHDHNVSLYSVNNDGISSFFRKLTTFLNVPYSFVQYRKLLKVLIRDCPDVVHVHNYFPLLSPSVFYACNKAKIPVVHTLHNYRAVCPTALLMHEGKITEQSITGRSWWTVLKKVYRGSWVGSFTLATMVELHKFLRTWQTQIDRFIALTDFSRQKYIEAGWPSDKVVVKPNFINDPFAGAATLKKRGGYALYIGRLSEEKGIDILFKAWENSGYPLKIVGDGPLKAVAKSKHNGNTVHYLGRKDKSEVIELVKNADFIIMPSTWYETFGMVIIEAFACGTPVIVSKLGSLQHIVQDRVTGLHFEPGNAQDLTAKVQWMVANPLQAKKMGNNARAEYLAKYTPEKNYEMLIDFYNQAIEEAGKPHAREM